MGWVALDRAAKLAAIRDDVALEKAWSEAAEEIRADILEHGVSDRGVLRQHYDTDALDASTLLAAIFGFLPGSDERMKNTVDAIRSELTEHGFVLRYVTGETDDGMSGKEGTFLICSFWLVSALSIVGERKQATDLPGPSEVVAVEFSRCFDVSSSTRGLAAREHFARVSPRHIDAVTARCGVHRKRAAAHGAGVSATRGVCTRALRGDRSGIHTPGANCGSPALDLAMTIPCRSESTSDQRCSGATALEDLG